MKEANLPFEQLRKVGIDETVFVNLPDKFKSDLLSGNLTDIIIVNMIAENGKLVEMPMKLLLIPDKNGDIDLGVFPVHPEWKPQKNLSKSTIENINNGMVVRFDREYLQKDPQTNNLIRIPEDRLKLNEALKDVEKIHDIELGTEQKEQLRNGKPVELNAGGEKITIGLDLKEPNHFKTLKGDLKDWEYQKQVDYDVQHPEFLGVVQTDENRWEYHLIQTSKMFPEQLNHKPAMTKSSGMKR